MASGLIDLGQREVRTPNLFLFRSESKRLDPKLNVIVSMPGKGPEKRDWDRYSHVFFRKFTRMQKFHKNHFIFILWSFGTEPKDWLFRAAVWNRFGFVVFGCIKSSSTPNKRGKFMKIWVLIFRWKRIKNFLKAHRRNWLKWILEVDTQPFKVKFYDDCAGGSHCLWIFYAKTVSRCRSFRLCQFLLCSKKGKIDTRLYTSGYPQSTQVTYIRMVKPMGKRMISTKCVR